MRKTVSIFGAIVALAALMLVPARPAQASASSQYLYVNAQVAAETPTYIWCNCYRWQGSLAGDFYIGDLVGINFLHGFPTAMTFPAAGRSHLEGVGLYNGLVATFAADFVGDTSMSFDVKVAGVVVWSSGVLPGGGDAPVSFVWAGVYMLP